MRRRKLLLAVPATLSVALLAAGCGSAAAPRAASIATAAAATMATTSRVTTVITMGSPGSPGSPGVSLTVTSAGAFDFTHSVGVLRMGDENGMPAEERFLPPRIYVKLPAATPGEALSRHGKSWLAVRGAEDGDAMTFLSDTGGVAGNPVNMLSALPGVAGRVTRTGNATIRGTRVTHYQVTIDPAKAKARARPADRADFAAFVKEMGSHTLRADVWIDGHGLVRRIAMALPASALQGPPPGTRVTQTVDFYDFGVPVRVTAPPAAEVMDLSEHPGNVAECDTLPSPPPASGTLPPAGAAAAERAARAFLSALANGDVNAAARAVVPEQRSMFAAVMQGAPRVRITSVHIVAVRPAGQNRATVVIKLNARLDSGGANVPPLPPGPGGLSWLSAAAVGGSWYVDLENSEGIPPLIPSCP